MRMLLVDDDATLRRSLRRRLLSGDGDGDDGVTIDEAGGVVEALTLLGAGGYDVIVSDEQLGDGFGRVFLATAARLQPLCRRALMSGAPEPPEEPAAFERFFAKADGLVDLVAWFRALLQEA